MGPLITVDFMHKVILGTKSEHDEDHLPVPLPLQLPVVVLVRYAHPAPSGGHPAQRRIATAAPAENPRPLLAAGVTALVMPCNTAHHWHDTLLCGCPVPFPNLIELAAEAAAARTTAGS